MSEDAVKGHASRMEKVLGAVCRRNGLEAVESRTPLDDVMEREEGIKEEVGQEVFTEYVALIMNLFFADGAHPAKVLRRVYAYAKKYRPELIHNMSVRDLGLLFGESGAAVSYRIKMIFDEPQARAGGKAYKAPWQKTAAACRSFSEAQKGNQNRRGGKSLPKS
jgi:hypothetical protein